jgi:60 kDa SS-A/Ro ribonucleoprotein
VDGFVVYTDNETYFGKVHPKTALENYRQKMGIDARLVVVGMTATKFSIAEPGNAAMMDVVGFSSDAPQLISGFVSGKF